MTKVLTRANYLDHTHPCTHVDYYSGIVSAMGVHRVVAQAPYRLLKRAKRILIEEDQDLSKISLANWDLWGIRISGPWLTRVLRERGDLPTQAGLVCIVKQAARMSTQETPVDPGDTGDQQES